VREAEISKYFLYCDSCRNFKIAEPLKMIKLMFKGFICFRCQDILYIGNISEELDYRGFPLKKRLGKTILLDIDVMKEKTKSKECVLCRISKPAYSFNMLLFDGSVCIKCSRIIQRYRQLGLYRSNTRIVDPSAAKGEAVASPETH